MAEEQHERLRRFVDEWRGEASAVLESAVDIGCTGFAPREAADANRDPVQLRTCIGDDSDVVDLVMITDNSILNKIVAVLAFDCIEMGRFQQLAQAKFYPRLLLFGLRPSGEDVIAEGELQKSFAKWLSFFNGLVEFIAELRSLIRNLVKQFESIYRSDAPRPYFLSCHLRTVFSSLVDGLSVLATLDEIISQNLSIGLAMSLFTRSVNLPQRFLLLDRSNFSYASRSALTEHALLCTATQVSDCFFNKKNLVL